MIVYKCKMCNGNLDMSEHKRLVKCNYCDTYQSVPSVLDENKAEMVNRANRYRQNGEFDRATSIYEQILREDATDPEIHWSIVLCKFGVEYVEDPATKRMIPTINRTQSHSILQDSDYQNALAIAEPDAKQYYMEEADKIDTIQRSIWRIAKDSEDYDVFISYKELGPDGQRTKSSTIAQSLYEGLTATGIKTFFSRVSLANKIGSEFEPYIFSALNSAYVMLVIGTDRDEFNAPWVKNEWSRYRKLTSTNSNKKLIPCVLDATMDDLPDELQPYQAQDLNKKGYEQELLDIVKDLVTKLKAGKSALNESDAEKLMKNGETYIVLKDFDTAEMIFRELCDKEPEDYRVWWGRIRSVTKDLSDADAGKKHSQDLRIWMDFLKKLAPAAKYSELLEKYSLYLKKVSKQSVFDEIENIKKIREQAIEQSKALENKLQDPTSSDNDLVAFCNEMEASINDAEEHLNLLNDQREQYHNKSGMFFTTCFILFGLSFIPLFFDITWPIILTAFSLIPCTGIAGYYNYRAEFLDPEIVKYECIKEEAESKLNKAQVSLEKGRKNLEKKRGYVQNTIQKCNDVVENADRYLTYDANAISNLLYAIMCSEIGENAPMNQELFQIREHTFQTIE